MILRPTPGWKRSALALVVFAAGCAPVGPDFVTPKTPVVTQWVEANTPTPDAGTGLTTRSEPVIAWWDTFRDPTLDKLIAQAYAENLTLQIAGARVLQARAQLGIAYGELYPQQQTVSGAYEQRRISESVGNLQKIDKIVPLDLNFATSDVSFDATWELDVWGGIRRGVQSARGNLAAQVANYDDALVTVTGDVAAIYINIRALQELLGIARANIALQQKSLDLTQLKFTNGVTTDLDVQESTALLNNTKALVPALESDLQQAINALGVLLAQPPSKMSSLLKSSRGIPSARSNVSVGVPTELLRRRPDIRAAEMQAAAQSAQVGVALADLYPQFGLKGSIGVLASSDNTLFAPASRTGLIAPGVVWNIFNYGQIRNNVRAQDAAYQALIANYQNTVLAAYAEVENAMVAYRKAQQQVGFLSESVTAAKKAADLAVQQYGDGIADYSRVLNTQQVALQSESRLIEAKSAVSGNLVAMYKALGGGWQIRKGREFLPDTVLAEMAHRTDWGDLLKPGAVTKAVSPVAN